MIVMRYLYKKMNANDFNNIVRKEYNMKFNFKNRVRNFKFSTSDIFVPLYEAIINSTQAIEERGNIDDARVDIKIERDSYRIAGFTSGIFSIEIIDNGIGFVEHNFESFCTSDSDYKVEIGGKGVGRINWLKAFEIVYVSSVYIEDGKCYERIFNFNIDEEIHNVKIREVEPDTPIETKIILYNLNQEFRSATEVPLREIAGKIIEHFASYFVIGAMPKITIADEVDKIDLNDFFEKEKFIETKNEVVTSNETTFNIRHVFLNASTNSKHAIYICAQNRVVCSYDVSNIEDLPTAFNINGKKAIYQCYVHSEFLDKDVNSERTYFSNVIFEDESIDDRPHFKLAINLYEVVYKQINAFLKDYLEPMRDIRNTQIHDFIENNCPQYKYLTKYASNEIKNISYHVASNPDKLMVELNKLNLKFNMKHNHQVGKTLQDGSTNAKEKLLNLVSPLKENLRSELANYLTRRIAMVDILERLLVLNPSLEELIQHFFLIDHHVMSDETNLWLVYDRLSLKYTPFYLGNNPSFIGYMNEREKEIVAIYFEDPTKIIFNKTNNPIAILEKECLTMHQMEDYTMHQFLIVSDSFSIISEGLAKKNVTVLTYQELIDNAKAKSLVFLKGNSN